MLVPINRKPFQILCSPDLPDVRINLAISALNDLTKVGHVTLGSQVIRGGRADKVLKAGLKAKRGSQLKTGPMLDTMIKDIQNDFPKVHHYDLLITDEDLYADDSTNFIFGVSQPFYACVFSFKRFLKIRGKMSPETAKTVLMHEIGHTLSLPSRKTGFLEEKLGTHCTQRCIMRQGMTLDEMKEIAKDRLAGYVLCDLCHQDLALFFWRQQNPSTLELPSCNFDPYSP